MTDPSPEQIAAELGTALLILNGDLVPFHERKQELFCKVCRYRDPLGPDGNKLHDENCSLLALHGAVEKTLALLRLPRVESPPPEFVEEAKRTQCVDSATDQHGYECVLCGHRLAPAVPPRTPGEA
jgi:hypothetical protein